MKKVAHGLSSVHYDMHTAPHACIDVHVRPHKQSKLTFCAALTQAFLSSRNCTISKCPFSAAMMRPVAPSCAAQAGVQEQADSVCSGRARVVAPAVSFKGFMRQHQSKRILRCAWAVMTAV